MKAIASVFVASALALSADAQAQVFKCLDAEGHTVFSDTMCGSNAERVEIVESSGGLSTITGNGLSPQEQSVLGAAEARATASASQSAQGGGRSAAAAPAASAPEPARRAY